MDGMNYLIAGGLLLCVLGWLVSAYQRMLQLRENAVRFWMQIEREVKQRHDMLIELLGNAVADFPLVGQEMSKVMSVNDSCMALLQQTPLMDNSREMENFVRQEKELSVVMENLFAVCEQHPEWKVGEHLPRLKREYGVSRHQLARLHHSYNVAVCVYNDTIHAFPSAIVARAFHFSEASLCE